MIITIIIIVFTLCTTSISLWGALALHPASEIAGRPSRPARHSHTQWMDVDSVDLVYRPITGRPGGK
jgi:hypothetical protein